MKRQSQYSQNFLKNPGLVKDLILKSSLKSNDVVIDIGAGSGVISSVLAENFKKVIAIESEPKTATKLRDNLKIFKNIQIVECDFLNFDLPNNDYSVFSNIPFHLSSPIVRKLTEANNPPILTYLFVQKQFGEKLIPDSNRFKSQLGMLIAPWFAVKIIKNLKRTDYFPHPNVDTVFIEIKKRQTPLLPIQDSCNYRKFITACFSDPRVFVKMPVSRLNLGKEIKPSQMKIEKWIELYHFSKTIKY